MKKQYRSEFDTRQNMRTDNYEIFYYSDTHFQSVSPHRHDYYEFYFPVSGKIEMEIEGTITPLSTRDAVIVPPHTRHRAITETGEKSYCRYVFWISVPYFNQLCTHMKDLRYITDRAEKNKGYICHFSENEYSLIQSRILRLIEEDHTSRYGRNSFIDLCISDLLLTMSRIAYDRDHPQQIQPQSDQIQEIMEYIENNIDEDLRLSMLGEKFFLSKYYIAHAFHERTGMTVHKYITKKRLDRCANEIKNGRPLNELYQEYGFNDYSSFFRAFKKEFSISPKEYQAIYLNDPAYPGRQNHEGR